MTFFSLFTH